MLYNLTEGEAWTSRLFLPERSGTRGCCPGMQESSAPEYQVIIVIHIALDNVLYQQGIGRCGKERHLCHQKELQALHHRAFSSWHLI